MSQVKSASALASTLLDDWHQMSDGTSLTICKDVARMDSMQILASVNERPFDVFRAINVGATGCCGLMAGLMFAYSASVIAGLADVAPTDRIVAMNGMNRALLNPFFGVIFFGAIGTSLALGVRAVVRSDLDARMWLLVGSVVYVVGVFLVTIAINVPMNSRLAALDPTAIDAAKSWDTYARRWVWVNHFRTFCAIVSATTFAVALTKP
jgi:uncharacterized membrane protein